MTPSFYTLSALQHQVGELVQRHGQDKDKSRFHDIVTQKAKLVISSVSLMTTQVTTREYQRLASQLNKLKVDVVGNLPKDVALQEKAADAVNMGAFFQNYDKITLIDPMALTPDSALAHRDEYQIVVDHLNAYRDWLLHLEAYETPQSVVMSPALELMRRRLYAFVYPKGQWSNRNVSSLWSKGYVIARPNPNQKDIALAFGTVTVVISFKSTMHGNLSLTVSGEK